MCINNKNNFQEKINNSIYFVEANSYERLSLWKEFKTRYNESDWKQDNTGHVLNIGNISNELFYIDSSVFKAINQFQIGRRKHCG